MSLSVQEELLEFSQDVRYTVTGAGYNLGFSAPKIVTRQELGKLLEEVGKNLQLEAVPADPEFF